MLETNLTFAPNQSYEMKRFGFCWTGLTKHLGFCWTGLTKRSFVNRRAHSRWSVFSYFLILPI